jgi:hypothetical protein
MRIFGFLGVLIVLCAGFFVYQRSAADVSEESGSPLQRIDTAAISQRLRAIASTQRQYQAQHGKYATLEELESAQLLPGGTEMRGYTFSATVSRSGFTITATPTDADKADWPTLEITEAMQVTER